MLQFLLSSFEMHFCVLDLKLKEEKKTRIEVIAINS